MSPCPRPRSTTRSRRGRGSIGRPIVVGFALLLGLVLSGCAAPFDPTGPCTADGNAPGAYPELEAAVPTAYQGAKPSELDSGRACTAAGLGTLSGHGVKELRFAGGTWLTGTDSGLSLAIFTNVEGPALDPAWMAEFYEAGARQGKNVTSVETTVYAVTTGITGSRLDVLNGESYQSVVVWERNGQVAVTVVADFIREIQTKDAHDAIVRAAVDAFVG
ncbi:MAG TPA: hypothetical protein VHM48_04965 [Candidatus Limnocylindrales bacterium]|nr:hypothetical protein [Candidatus Limnocylindrales bacterium]